MKKKILIAVLILAIVLSVTLAFTLGAGAEEADPALSIGGKSLILGNSIYLRYMVAAENVADINDVSLLVWNEPQDAFVKGTEKYEVKWVTGTTKRNGITYYHFEFQDVAAKRLADDFYAVVYTKVGDKEYYSKADKYSVLKYAYNMMGKLDKAASTNTKLLNMLDAMLDYGATAQYYFDNYRTDRLANDDFYQIKVEGGDLPDGFADGLYLEGDKVVITADAPAEGYEFSGWKKESTGEIISTDAIATVEVYTANETYTAIYKESVKYSEGLKFELNADKQSYSVSGIGSCKDTEVVIPPTYNGLPVTAIGYRAFYWCSKLTRVAIPDSVTAIGSYAFCDCSSLTSVTILDSVTSIGSAAFWGCISLTSVTIPNGVTEIGDHAFSGCSSLTSITVSAENANYKDIDGNLYTKDGKTLLQYAIGKSDTSFIIPDSVTTIGSYAFYNCASLTSVTIGNSVTTIGSYAFHWCTGLTSVTIPNNVTTIGRGAFYSCTSLTSVTIGNSVTTIGDSAFYGCTSLTSITVSAENEIYKSIDGNLYTKDGKTLLQYAIGKSDTSFIIPDSVTTIGSSAFSNCKSLTSVTIPDSVTTIGNHAFYDCTSLTSVTILDSVTAIGSYAFSICTSLNDVYFNGTEEEWKEITIDLGNDQLLNANIHYLGEPKYSEGLEFTLNSDKNSYSVTGIGSCKDTDLVIPATYNGLPVTTIGSKAFRDCTSLTSVTIPDSVTTIGSYAFLYCTKLTDVTIGNSVTTIGSEAFYDCDSLTSVTIPDSVTTIGSYAFAYCTGLTSVNITDIAAWCNIKFASSYANPLYYAKNLYLNGELVTELIIPEGVTTIGDYAFYYCTSLTSVTIPDSVTTIGSRAFYYCTSLTSVTIPDSVTTIGSRAFAICESLTSVTIPNSVTTISSYAFYNCSSLTDVDYNGTEEEWNSITIGNGNNSLLNATIHFLSEPEKELYIRSGDYIYFGEYPQTIKADDVTITETQDSRGYYLGSDGCYYAKVVADPDESSYTFSTGANITDGTTYYFKVEPIRWRILSEDGETAFILCDSIIANMAYQSRYYSSYGEYYTTANGAPDETYANNYKYSTVRAWLNNEFYNTAFSALQQEIIITTTVDNGVLSTGSSPNPYACENTEDKIFLPSLAEITNADYGFTTDFYHTETREMLTSDYSRATGARMSTSSSYLGNGYWWLRSPNRGLSDGARFVDSNIGISSTSVNNSSYGVVPALQIRL